MIRSLPKWVEFGSFLLALIAGTINAIGLLGFQHQSVSHLSGSATLLGAQVASMNFASVAMLLAVLISFVIGSAISGAFLCGESFKVGRYYDTLLAAEGLLLLAACILLSIGMNFGLFLASMACGLQNALATRYSDAVVRTTHVTGLFTDLGLMIGSHLRGEAFDSRKAKLFLFIITGFISGGCLGALLFNQLQFLSLLVPVILCFSLAVVYRVYFKQKGNRLYL
ncbi:YoaK family protein [Vibrio sp. SCSIO 43136]|uniref:YoaK family protein n=1 Tax=Vibrio sp. SCSIO 43136 TaxID=2819101 RepID=UPI0020750347|nr:YoaK family protein [Vibrio sp. SCSIO 43136]USD66291.1 DUF1275 domain-containing protein [Vibrio sp. SCSIO 43136]